MAVTMQQIAQEAGVSLGTVSNVLNNRTNVKKKNYDKVMAAVEKLKYQRGPAVDTLKMPFPSNFALLLPDTARAFYSELIRGVEDAAWSAGYGMMLGSFDRIKSKQRQYMEMYARKNLAGIIIHKPMSSCDTINEYFGDRTVVLLDANDSYRGKFPIINADDRGGMRAAMQFLYDHGHRRIAYISGLFEVESSVRRLNVYKEFLVEKGIGIEEALIKNGNYDWHSGYTQASALLRLVNPPTAIFAANDLMAIGAIKAAYERGLRVPGDISIMGHDDIEMAALYMPPLTTVRQPRYEIGVFSVEMLLKQIQKITYNEPVEPVYVQRDNELVVRESVSYIERNVVQEPASAHARTLQEDVL